MFHIAFAIKRLFVSDLRYLERKEKENWRCRRPEWVTAYFRVSVATENSLSRQRIQASCHDSKCSVATGVGRVRQFQSRHGFLSHDRAFWLCVAT